MNVDQWIKEHSGSMNPKHEELKRERIGDQISKNGEKFSFGEIYDKESIDDWNIICTIGDGSCLIHCFLTLLSPIYNSFSRNDKIVLGKAFRLWLSDRIHITENQRMTMKKVYQHRPDEYLGDEFVKSIGEYLGYNVVFLQLIQTKDGKPIPLIISFAASNSVSPVLFILTKGGVAGLIGSGTHFDAVERVSPIVGSRFTSSIDILNEIEKVTNRLLLQSEEVTNRLLLQSSPDRPEHKATRKSSVNENENENEKKTKMIRLPSSPDGPEHKATRTSSVKEKKNEKKTERKSERKKLPSLKKREADDANIEVDEDVDEDADADASSSYQAKRNCNKGIKIMIIYLYNSVLLIFLYTSIIIRKGKKIKK